MQRRVLEEYPSLPVLGHARRGFEPSQSLPDRPVKGAFKVTVRGPDGDVLIVETGPEPRPFPDLKALDLEKCSLDALDALDDLDEAQ